MVVSSGASRIATYSHFCRTYGSSPVSRRSGSAKPFSSSQSPRAPESVAVSRATSNGPSRSRPTTSTEDCGSWGAASPAVPSLSNMSNGQSSDRGQKYSRFSYSGAVSSSSRSKTAASPSCTVARFGTGMIQAAVRASPETVRLITICSSRPSQRTTDISRFTYMLRRPSGTIAPQPQAYAGATSDASWSPSRARTITNSRPRALRLPCAHSAGRARPRTKPFIPRALPLPCRRAALLGAMLSGVCQWPVTTPPVMGIGDPRRGLESAGSVPRTIVIRTEQKATLR